MKGRSGPSFIDKEDAASVCMATTQAVLPPSPVCQLSLRNRGLNSYTRCCRSTVRNHKRLPSSWGQSSNTAARGEPRQRRCVPGAPGSAGLGKHTWRARRRLARAAESAGSPADCISRKSLEAVFPPHCPQRVAFLPTRKFLPGTQLRPLSNAQLTPGVRGRC